MDDTDAKAWAEMAPSDRFVFILGMIREKFPSISNESERNLCHIGQHPQCLRWLLRENIESGPVGLNNVGNWAKKLEEKGLIKRDKNEDTLIFGKKQVLGSTNSRIAYLTDTGINHYSKMIKQQNLDLELFPDWFLFMCLDENISSPEENKDHYPIPVSIHDFRPINRDTFETDACDDEIPVRNGFLLNKISNFSYSDLSRLLRDERGIHLLTGGAGSGKTQILQSAAKAWFMPHVAHNNSAVLHVTFSCRKYAEHLIERETPPEDEKEFQQWCERNSRHYPPEPDTIDDAEWENYERETSRINLELTVKALEDYIFENYVQHLPNTTSKEMPLDMIRDANPELAIFADGLDEISNEFRNRILNQLNSLIEKNPMHRVLIASRPIQTPEQFQPELQTQIQLMELPINWPSKNSSLQLPEWPKGLERTPLTWMLVNSTNEKTSEGASEAEILDQYLDDCMEKALKREKPPLPKKKIWDILRKTALLHCEIGVNEFCEIPGGFDDEDSVNEWEVTQIWVYLHMQIIQEVPGWRVSGFEHMTVLSTTCQFSHRTVQEYLASQAFGNLEDFLKWCDHQKIQNPEWCWPVIRYAMLSLDGKEKIIQHLSGLDEDILGHRQGLIDYLNGKNKEMLPIGIPENHRKLEMKNTLDSVGSESVHEYPQIDSGESRATVDGIIEALEWDEKHGPDGLDVFVDWEAFGLEPTFLECLTHRLLEQKIRALISSIRRAQPERSFLFWEYYTKLLWISKKPAQKELDEFAKPFEEQFMKFNWSLDEWIEPWEDARVCAIAERESRNEVMRETHRMNLQNPVPFEGPERQMMHFLDKLGLPLSALELTWMFGFKVPTYTFNRWVSTFNIDSYENVYSHKNSADERFGWILTLCQEIRSKLILNDGPWPRIRHPRFKNQKLSSTVPNQPNTPGELLDLMEAPPPIMGKIIINASSSRFELEEMLTEAEKSSRIDLLKRWLFMKPDFYIEPEKKREFERLGVSTPIFNHYRNQFVEHWCLSPYVSGELPLLKDYPWFEELWG